MRNTANEKESGGNRGDVMLIFTALDPLSVQPAVWRLLHPGQRYSNLAQLASLSLVR